MGSFEWMEVETLSSEITALEARLEAAKSRHNYGLVKVVKEQITAAHQRRARYLAHISTSVAEGLDPSRPVETSTEAKCRKAVIAEPDQPGAELADPVTQEVPEELAEPDQQSAELVEAIATSGVASAGAGAIDGAGELWDRLTPSHIERAKHELGTPARRDAGQAGGRALGTGPRPKRNRHLGAGNRRVCREVQFAGRGEFGGAARREARSSASRLTGASASLPWIEAPRPVTPAEAGAGE